MCECETWLQKRCRAEACDIRALAKEARGRVHQNACGQVYATIKPQSIQCDCCRPFDNASGSSPDIRPLSVRLAKLLVLEFRQTAHRNQAAEGAGPLRWNHEMEVEQPTEV